MLWWLRYRIAITVSPACLHPISIDLHHNSVFFSTLNNNNFKFIITIFSHVAQADRRRDPRAGNKSCQTSTRSARERLQCRTLNLVFVFSANNLLHAFLLLLGIDIQSNNPTRQTISFVCCSCSSSLGGRVTSNQLCKLNGTNFLIIILNRSFALRLFLQPTTRS